MDGRRWYTSQAIVIHRWDLTAEERQSVQNSELSYPFQWLSHGTRGLRTWQYTEMAAATGLPASLRADAIAVREHVSHAFAQGLLVALRTKPKPIIKKPSQPNLLTRPIQNTNPGSVISAAKISAAPLNCVGNETPVPLWSDLPPFYQSELKEWEKFLSDPDDTLRLTVLNLYVKLRRLNFWIFVGPPESSTSRGCLEFLCIDVDKLRDELCNSNLFSYDGDKAWEGREIYDEGALHFKHFGDWPASKVQAHIDREGLHHRHYREDDPMEVPLWGIATAIQFLKHQVDAVEDGYTDVYGIRRILLNQGYDPVPLTGSGKSKG